MQEPPVRPSPDAAGEPLTLRAAFDAMPRVMAVLEGPEHRLVGANRAWRRLVGDRDFIGRPAREVMPDIEGQRLFEMLDRAFVSGETVVAHEWRIQMQPAGPETAVELFMDFTLTPWRGDDGRVRGVLVDQEDVTARVRQREAERERTRIAERRLEAARDVVAELQRNLLPTGLPVLADVDLAARYIVATRDQTAGGDWFDALPHADGTVSLVVGDVVGHGVAASAAMGRVRAVLAELLGSGAALEDAVARVDGLAARDTLRGTTLLAGTLDPGTGTFRYVSCGHPPPLVARADGSVGVEPIPGTRPLGHTGARTTVEVALGEDDVLVLYSDGLVEREDETLADGLHRLQQVVADAVGNRAFPLGAPTSTVERVCQQSVELLTREGYDDDVTVLVARRRREAVGRLRRLVPATVEGSVGLLQGLRSWCAVLQVASRDGAAVELAVSELVANVLEHAYPPGRPGRVWLEASLRPDGVLEVEVGDDGVWEEPAHTPATSGRGLWIAQSVVDELTVRPGRAVDTVTSEVARGTRVVVRHRLTRPVTLGVASPDVVARRPATAFRTELVDGRPATVRVHGAVDTTAASLLADRLDTASRGGLHAVVVDLSDVSLLGSAGVSALFRARERHREHGHDLVVRVRAGSPPAHVLALVSLPHTAV